jgi:hypothetical protein
MSTFCLIHSSGQGPGGWRLLAERLEDRGHHVLTPAFRVSETDKGAAWHAETLAEELRRSRYQSSEVFCVAHSAGGMFLPLLAEIWQPRQMVFLAALIPRPGISIIDQFRADPSMFQPAWVGKDPMNDDVALEFVYHDCPRDRIDWALSTRVVLCQTRNGRTMSINNLAVHSSNLHRLCRRSNDFTGLAAEGLARMARSRADRGTWRPLPACQPTGIVGGHIGNLRNLTVVSSPPSMCAEGQVFAARAYHQSGRILVLPHC